ncbi:hypothetical protein BJ684DRAFT_16733 [Piptocephalis cylindrospora]|uniref:Uncharacterized protein n=1 Tax=Piptocephalis cylindrospora TaxID=1907219 RepID=A0A4P9Y1Z1_9FUNG|nr:hypothetical protein BJ684DRAFT_16733 [Piptocephalis cylindrospora]|eukprot:RKP12815.1 hypothetical protein BJ684DRAFT_16733 [Piptocephalis cylindrospora]
MRLSAPILFSFVLGLVLMAGPASSTSRLRQYFLKALHPIFQLPGSLDSKSPIGELIKTNLPVFIVTIEFFLNRIVRAIKTDVKNVRFDYSASKESVGNRYAAFSIYVLKMARTSSAREDDAKRTPGRFMENSSIRKVLRALSPTKGVQELYFAIMATIHDIIHSNNPKTPGDGLKTIQRKFRKMVSIMKSRIKKIPNGPVILGHDVEKALDMVSVLKEYLDHVGEMICCWALRIDNGHRHRSKGNDPGQEGEKALTRLILISKSGWKFRRYLRGNVKAGITDVPWSYRVKWMKVWIRESKVKRRSISTHFTLDGIQLGAPHPKPIKEPHDGRFWSITGQEIDGTITRCQCKAFW